MKTNLYTYLLLWMFVGMFGCEAEYVPTTSIEPAKVVCVGEVVSGYGILARISTSLDQNGNGNFERPRDAQCKVTLGNGDIIELLYEPERAAYWSPYSATAEEELSIRVKLKNQNYPAIIATTTVPAELSAINMSAEISKTESSDYYDANINIDFDFNQDDVVNYIKLYNPRLEYKPFIIENGEKVIVGPRIVRTMDYILDESSDNFYKFNQHYGVYIDLTEDNLASLKLTSSEAIPVNYELTAIYMEYFSVNEEIFKYNKSIDAIIESQHSPYAQPIVNYSNIGGGIGVFGAYKQYLDTIQIVQ